MRQKRSGSQILFNHLPDQTIDAEGSVWKVRSWDDAITEHSIDSTAIRDELKRSAYPWKDNDGGFYNDLFAGKSVTVKKVNRDSGVRCDPFPKLYHCKRCKRLYDEPTGACECGYQGNWGQLPFVGYHDACGTLKTPYVKRCPIHRQRAVKFPGSASASELIFYCPVPNCKWEQRGFNSANCDCATGGQLKYTVHRASVVFRARGIVMINPPRREILKEIEVAGGGARALEWVISGMEGKLRDAPSIASSENLRKVLSDQGYNDGMIDKMIAVMPPTDGKKRARNLSEAFREDAEHQARQIALATFESRIKISDLFERSKANDSKSLYGKKYPRAFLYAGLERIELIDKFPVLTAQFGYTRGNPEPGKSYLKTYWDRQGGYTLYGDLAQTEALFIRLDPLLILKWLEHQGYKFSQCSTAEEATTSILEAASSQPTVQEKLTLLVHSYSHSLIRRTAIYAGIERSSLSEIILPSMFGFFVYAAAKGDFILGGLQAMFESDLEVLLQGLVDDEHRCALDPGCSETGGSCAVCMHLGEPSCRLFNVKLSRQALVNDSQTGYFDLSSAIDPI